MTQVWSCDLPFSMCQDSFGFKFLCTGRWLHNFKSVTDPSFILVKKQQKKFFCGHPDLDELHSHTYILACTVSNSWTCSLTMVVL